MIQKLKSEFLKEFNEAPDLITRAPGRINLIGEHTDYNLGLVFPAAIDKSMYFAFKTNGTNSCRLCAYDKNEKVTIELDKMDADLLWAKYCVGVIQEVFALGISLEGFDCLFMSDIPIGAGVSSSAALECGFVMGLNTLSNSNLDKWEMAKIGNRAENNYLGIQSGILDQFSSIFGLKNKAMLMDCASQDFTYHDVNIDPYTLVLINTNVKHSHLSSGYNDRPSECRAALKIAQQQFSKINSLSDLNKLQLETIKTKLSETLYKRTLFVIEENARVLLFKNALKEKNYNALGQLLYESHEGLETLYEVSCKELNILVNLSRKEPSIKGARMMGGGFGGCTLNLIEIKNKEKIIESMCEAYFNKTGITAIPYYIHIGQGAELL